jgi:AcrR family transcriptional regulator
MEETRPPRSRAARRPTAPRLSRERIVEAALALVADETLAGLSTRRLGQRLGCEAMSIYHHFPSKQHLIDALVDHAIASVQLAPPGPDPLARLRASVHAYRAMAEGAPALFPIVAIHRLNTPTGIRFIESLLEQVHAVAPDDELAARWFRAIGYYMMGCCLDETSGYATGPTAAEPVDDAYIAAHAPHLARGARTFERAQWQRTFELGLEALLGALARDGAELERRKRRS